MRVRRELAIEAAPEQLWALLWDVPRMAACLPGCTEAVEVVPRERYRARMTQKVGPISLSVPLDVQVVSVEPPRRLALSASGRDPMVGTDIHVRITLECGAAEGGSRLGIDADAQILGKLGALGHGVIQRKAEDTLEEFGRRLARAAKA